MQFNLKKLAGALLGVLAVGGAAALAQTAGNVVLHGPSFNPALPLVTPEAIATAVNSALGLKADATNGTLTSPTVNGTLTVDGLNVSTRLTTTLYARDYGVVADGTTSDDQALGLALYACAQAGTELVLPAGDIALTGATLSGNATRTIQNCAVRGTGSIWGNGSFANHGTTFKITSTTVGPFNIGSGWSMQNINAYWPNQTAGTTVYPAFMTMMLECDGWWMKHVNIINSYDFITKNPSGGSTTGTGSWFISDSWIWTQNDVFKLPFVGDSIHLNGVIFDPGNWLQICGFSAPCKAAIDARHNTVFNVVNTLNLSMDNTHFFAWDTLFKIASTGVASISNTNFEFDGVATVIDASSGGLWSGENLISGAGNCHRYNYATDSNSGNAPCFTMGGNANTALKLNNLHISDASGSLILTAGTNVTISNSEIGSIGSAADGAEYYDIHTTANAGGLNVIVENSTFSGILSSTHSHGVKTDVAATRLAVQNSRFVNFNDVLDVQAAATTIIAGNFSVGTQGTESVKMASLNASGNAVSWSVNQWDKPPLAAVSACGTAPSIYGTLSGLIVTGSGTVTSCTITLPFKPPGPLNGGLVLFQDFNGVTLSQSVTGSPPAITITGTNFGSHFVRWAGMGDQ